MQIEASVRPVTACSACTCGILPRAARAARGPFPSSRPRATAAPRCRRRCRRECRSEPRRRRRRPWPRHRQRRRRHPVDRSRRLSPDSPARTGVALRRSPPSSPPCTFALAAPAPSSPSPAPRRAPSPPAPPAPSSPASVAADGPGAAGATGTFLRDRFLFLAHALIEHREGLVEAPIDLRAAVLGRHRPAAATAAPPSRPRRRTAGRCRPVPALPPVTRPYHAAPALPARAGPPLAPALARCRLPRVAAGLPALLRCRAGAARHRGPDRGTPPAPAVPCAPAEPACRPPPCAALRPVGTRRAGRAGRARGTRRRPRNRSHPTRRASPATRRSPAWVPAAPAVPGWPDVVPEPVVPAAGGTARFTAGACSDCAPGEPPDEPLLLPLLLDVEPLLSLGGVGQPGGRGVPAWLPSVWPPSDPRPSRWSLRPGWTTMDERRRRRARSCRSTATPDGVCELDDRRRRDDEDGDDGDGRGRAARATGTACRSASRTNSSSCSRRA